MVEIHQPLLLKVTIIQKLAHEGQHTMYVVNACGPCDAIGTKIRSFFGNRLECKVATEMVNVDVESEAYKLMMRHRQEQIERLVERFRQGTAPLQRYAYAQLIENFGKFGEDDDVSPKNALSVLGTVKWLAGDNHLQHHYVKKLKEDFGYICPDASLAQELYCAALGGWDPKTIRNADNEAAFNTMKSRGYRILFLGGKDKVLLKTSKKSLVEVTDDDLNFTSFFSRVDKLKAYKEEHGHLNVQSIDDQSLYDYCYKVRNSRRAIIAGKGRIYYSLDDDRIAALDAISTGNIMIRQR
jgi:hypothetical protein